MKGAIIGFLIGAVAGGAAVYFGLKRKLEKEAEEKFAEEVKSVERVARKEAVDDFKEFVGKKSNEKALDGLKNLSSFIEDYLADETEDEVDILYKNDDVIAYAKKLSDERYTKTPVVEDDDDVIPPYLIDDPNKFGENEDWGVRYFIYYSDGVVTDEDQAIVPSPESMLGTGYDILLKKSEDGTIQIANPNTRTYYEVESIGGPYNDDFDLEEEDDEEDSWE